MGLALIYCKSNRQCTTLGLLESLLRQLLLTLRTAPPETLELLRKFKTEERRLNVAQIVKELCKMANQLERFFIFLDGFDELFPKEFQEYLLSALKVLCQEPSIRLMILSRPLPTIRRLLAGSTEYPVVATSHDIRTHIKTSVTQNSALHHIVISPVSILERVIDKIEEKSKQM
jgi:adenylate kinase